MTPTTKYPLRGTLAARTSREELKAWATLALILILSGLADAATL